MDSSLETAKGLAEKVRYSGDFLPQNLVFSDLNSAMRFYSHSGLKISDRVTPIIYKSISTVCERLSISFNSFEAYVYCSSEPQATCFSDGKDGCVLALSSSMVQLLSAEELQFVIGHELGHFLLMHGSEPKAMSLEDLIGVRAREISADRVGLIACKSIENSVRALMKTVSGLGDDHIRYDTGQFLSQLRSNEGDALRALDSSFKSTHPTMLVRCRALVLFSLHENETGSRLSKSLKNLDNILDKDLDRFIDGPVKKELANRQKDLLLWLCVKRLSDVRVFSKENQAVVKGEFGEQILSKVKDLMRTHSKIDLDAIVDRNIASAKEFLSTSSFEVALEKSVKILK